MPLPKIMPGSLSPKEIVSSSGFILIVAVPNSAPPSTTNLPAILTLSLKLATPTDKALAIKLPHDLFLVPKEAIPSLPS